MRKRALSTILTTIIILVAAAVLASGVTLYGSSLFKNETQLNSISTFGANVWVNATDPNGVSWGAIAVRNSGDKIISISSIDVRGTSVPFSSWYADHNQTSITVNNFQSELIINGTDSNGNTYDSIDSGGTITSSCPGIDENVIELDFDGNKGGGPDDKPTLCLSVQSGPLALNPGERSIIYFRIPDGTLSSLDSGDNTSLNIYASSFLSPQTVTIGNP